MNTEKWQQAEAELLLIRVIMEIDHASAPELAMTLVKGINLQNLFWRTNLKAARILIPETINSFNGQRNDNGHIPINEFLQLAWEGEVQHFNDVVHDFTLMAALYHFHPRDNYDDFEGPLDGFEPQHAEERFSFLLDGCSIRHPLRQTPAQFLV